jgi:acyl carrier protein
MKTARAIDKERLPSEIQQLVANVVDRDPEEIGLNANLADELEIDSVMRLEILVVLERTYGIKIDQDDLARIVSLKDVCDMLLEKAASPTRASV